MARFFFDFCQGKVHVIDAVGLEFPTVERAYLEVFKAAQEMWSELLKKRRDPHRCSFEVRDETGQILFTFPFGEVLECCTDRMTPQFRQTFTELGLNRARLIRLQQEFCRDMDAARRTLQESRRLLKEASEVS
jgi:hypothetical protein